VFGAEGVFVAVEERRLSNTLIRLYEGRSEKLYMQIYADIERRSMFPSPIHLHKHPAKSIFLIDR
jgi:hypothetical protein